MQRRVLLTIALGGALGALARYGMARMLPAPAGGFPWATFWTNVSGSLAIGVVLVLLVERFSRSHLARPLLVTGFLGAYTTFSTYAVGTDLLLRSHELLLGAVYALGSVLGGLVAVFAGVLLARLAIRLERDLLGELDR